MRKVLIIGRIPPPIGGVTVHVSRLLESLKAHHFDHFDFCDLINDRLADITQKIIRYNVIHLHISNPMFQLVFALVCKISRKTLLMTYHGNWGRYGVWGNGAVNWSARLCSVPIVQNLESLGKALQWNKNARMISTFIPSTFTKPLSALDSQKLSDFRRRFPFVFCTNAWNLVFDRNGAETYGITEIISSIAEVSNAGLIISDPSGKYGPYIRKTFGQTLHNVLIIEGQHDFGNVLRVADAFIRNTSTDGVSLSIHEAYEHRVVVLASNSISRAHFCNVYNKIADIDLITELEKGKARLANEPKIAESSTTVMLIGLYTKYI